MSKELVVGANFLRNHRNIVLDIGQEAHRGVGTSVLRQDLSWQIDFPQRTESPSRPWMNLAMGNSRRQTQTTPKGMG